MCYNGKCCGYLRVETGTLIFAILNFIHLSLTLLTTVGTLFYNNARISSVEPSRKRRVLSEAFTINILLSIMFCLVAIHFAFTIVLINGLNKKKARLVKVYFIYSLVSHGIALVGIFMYMLQTGFTGLPAYILYGVMFGICVQGPVLWMIRMTYKKFEADALKGTVMRP